jgi:hypothetical protein
MEHSGPLISNLMGHIAYRFDAIHIQSDWITAQERAGSREGGCVDTPVLSVSTDASEMTYVVSIHASHVSYVQVTKQWLT